MRRLWSIVLVFLAGSLFAQDRGMAVKAAQDAGLTTYDPTRMHALVIGIDEYAEWPDLRCAANDARAVAHTLRSVFGYRDVKLLLNDQATRRGVLNALDKYLPLGEEDSLLVFYAGHGWMDEYKNGYWVPADAPREGKADYISNSQLVGDYFRKFKVKHLLVVADSCFSGALLRGGASSRAPGWQLPSGFRKPSRYVLTSGDLAPVADDAGGGHSPFTTKLLQYMRYEDQAAFGVQDMYVYIRKYIKSEPICQPLDTPMHMAGGEYVFCRITGETPIRTASKLPEAKAPAVANIEKVAVAPVKVNDFHSPAKSDPLDLGKVVVQVNDAKLTEGELARQAAEQYERVSAMVPPEQAEAYRGQMRVEVAQTFIVTTLLEAEAAKRGITVTAADIEKAIDDITKRIPKDMTLNKVLEAEGLTMDALKDRLKKDLRIKKMFDQEITVTDREIADFYYKQKASFELPEQVSVSHILVKVEEKDDDAAKAAKKARIEGLKKQLNAGGDFAELAKANSDCPSAKDGGKLPMFSRGDMVAAFSDAAFSQKPNVDGPVVETEFGYHLVKVHEKKPGRLSPLDEVKDKIADYLKMTKSRTVIPPFVDKLRAEAKVTIDPDLQKAMDAQKLAEQAKTTSPGVE